MEFINIIGINNIIAFIALIFSIFATVMTVMYNRTAYKLNKKLLSKECQDEIEENTADISAEFIKTGIQYQLRILNTGQCIAKNVRINEIGSDVLRNMEVQFPFEALEPCQIINVIAFIHKDSPRKIELKITWDDQDKINREKKLHVPV